VGQETGGGEMRSQKRTRTRKRGGTCEQNRGGGVNQRSRLEVETGPRTSKWSRFLNGGKGVEGTKEGLERKSPGKAMESCGGCHGHKKEDNTHKRVRG